MYSATTVCGRAGLTYRQLDYWVTTGLLRPRGAGRGSGRPRTFDDRDVLEAHVAARLTEAGATLSVAREAVAALREVPDGALERSWLVIGRDGVRVVEDLEVTSEVLAAGGATVIVAVASMLAAIGQTSTLEGG